jgi:hypothetical protein
MGYRFVLRKFTYPNEVKAQAGLGFTSWWENKGVAPCYKDFLLAFRLRNDRTRVLLPSDADVRTWLPGDVVYDDKVFLPLEIPQGDYVLELALLDRTTRQPKVRLAISGRTEEGWYPLGKIAVVD